MKSFHSLFIFAALLLASATGVASDFEAIPGSPVPFDSAEPANDLTDWVCRAQSPGYDRHGYHYGNSRAEALNRCQLFHAGLTCTVECR